MRTEDTAGARGTRTVTDLERPPAGTGWESPALVRRHRTDSRPDLFDTHEAAGWWPRDPTITRLSAIVQDAWLSFAATGAPDAEGLPPWPAAGPDRPHVMVLDEEPPVEPTAPLGLLRRLAARRQGRF